MYEEYVKWSGVSQWRRVLTWFPQRWRSHVVGMRGGQTDVLTETAIIDGWPCGHNTEHYRTTNRASCHYHLLVDDPRATAA